MSVNVDKMKVLHFRKKITPKTNRKVTLNGNQIDIVSSYKYLGVEFLGYTHTAILLCESAGGALGALVAKYHNLNGLGYDSYTKIYQSTVLPVSD